VRVVDPACGSGAFLIGAFRRLLREREAVEGFRRTLDPRAERRTEADLTRAILDRNLHGVDISGSAVEIAKLVLWLHSASADAPLSSLDGALKCGNSLVEADFYAGGRFEGMRERERERVNAFSWIEAFSFGGDDPGRFDIVLGNPPYVKLQNLRQVSPDVADYLADPRGGRGYRSTQSGAFDLYLPFIEKGLDLLRPGGRMGYIAPSLWAVNEYGEALRNLVRERRALSRWVDFRSPPDLRRGDHLHRPPVLHRRAQRGGEGRARARRRAGRGGGGLGRSGPRPRLRAPAARRRRLAAGHRRGSRADRPPGGDVPEVG